MSKLDFQGGRGEITPINYHFYTNKNNTDKGILIGVKEISQSFTTHSTPRNVENGQKKENAEWIVR